MGLFSQKNKEPKMERNVGLPMYYIEGKYYYRQGDRMIEVPKSQHPHSPPVTEFKR